MGQSLLFGAIASSALIIGALIGVRFELPKRLLAVLLSFAAGALITALAFELFEDAFEKGGIWRAAIGLFVGALVFTLLSALLDRAAQPGTGKAADEHPGSAKLDTDAAASDRPATKATTRGAAGLALLAAVTLDGVPENVAMGVSLSEGSGGSRCSPPSSSRTCRKRSSVRRRCARRGCRGARSWGSGRSVRCCSWAGWCSVPAPSRWSTSRPSRCRSPSRRARSSHPWPTR